MTFCCPGGMVIIQDYMRIDESAERKRLDTFEDMYVLVAFDPGAGDREGKEVASWLEASGFPKYQNHCPAYPTGARYSGEAFRALTVYTP